MKTPSRSLSPKENPDTPESDRSFDDVEGLFDFAREYFAGGFPNPERRGCPPPGHLESIVKSGEPPGDEIRAHLFQCSECFRDFRQSMEIYGNSLPSRPPHWWNRLVPFSGERLPLLAAAVFLVAFIIGVAWLSRERFNESSQDQASAPLRESPDGNPAPGAEKAPDSPSQPEEPPPLPAKQRGQKDKPLIARNTIRIDLDEFPQLREGGETDTGKAIHLPASLMRVVLILPEGSVAGGYTITVEDQSGNARITSNARSLDGKTLSVTLNLSRLAGSKNRLCVLRGSEPRLCYPLTINRGER